MSANDSDPKTPPVTTEPTDEENPNDVDATMGAAVEPAPVDPTSEDLEDAELDDTEDRD